jgi:hypothetical protein
MEYDSDKNYCILTSILHRVPLSYSGLGEQVRYTVYILYYSGHSLRNRVRYTTV